MSDLLFNLKKVDFFWINREQRSFEWFVHLLSQLELEQAEERRHESHSMGSHDQSTAGLERFLDMHMYITSALQRTDMRAVALNLALDLLYQKVNYAVYNATQKYESTFLHTYVQNEFLTADLSFKNKT